MRHRKNTVKLGRTSSQRAALFSSLVSNLILAKRIKTTLPKARAAKRMADKMVTLARKNDFNARRRAASLLQDADAVKKLFETVVPMMEGRPGGFTRITKLGRRPSDSSEMCVLAWVDEKYEPKAATPAAPAETAAQA